MREVRKEHEGVFNTLVNSVNFVAEFSEVSHLARKKSQ